MYKGIAVPGRIYDRYGLANGAHGGRNNPILSKYNCSSIKGSGGYAYGA